MQTKLYLVEKSQVLSIQMHGNHQTLGFKSKKQKYFGLKDFCSQTHQQALYQKDKNSFDTMSSIKCY